MKQNIQYIPASNPDVGRWSLDYTPANIGAISNIQNNKKSCYIPCSSAAVPGPIGVISDTVSKLSWWEPNSFFNYPFLLISAYYGMKWKYNFREFFNIPDNFCIIGDSGGFQNMTMNANLDPIKVLRWQEKYCQIGLTFDLPLLEKNYKIRREKMIQTAENSKIAFKNRKNINMKLYACFHGHNIEEQNFMKEQYNRRISLNNFDGIAYGGLVFSAGNTEYLIKILTLFCYNVYEYKLPVHFFGLSGNKIVPYIIYLQKKFNLNITFDSSSYGGGAMRREFWKGNNLEKIKVMETDFKTIPCDCPVCSVVKDWNEYKKDGSLAGGLISLHNLYQTLISIEKLKLNFDDKILNKKYKKFIDAMYEHGPSKAYQILTPIDNIKCSQKNIFGY